MAADREMAALQHPRRSNEQKVLLQKFRLYETRSKFYLVGRDKSRTYWKVLKIDRSEPSELNIREDPATYSENECLDLLKRIHDGNRSTGGLKLVTKCYGIIGFVKFLGPYYMLLITRRRKIGTICGHTIYAVSKSEMITLPNSTVLSNMRCSKDENRSFVHSACETCCNCGCTSNGGILIFKTWLLCCTPKTNQFDIQSVNATCMIYTWRILFY